MSKQIQKDSEIYLTPTLKGIQQNDNPIVIDENGKKLNPRDINDKIEIYKREVEEWFLEPALKLVKDRDYRFNNAFIILMICMAYFEGVEQYKTGVESPQRSKECFKDSIKRIYPNEYENKDIDNLYSKSRCGLYHNGMVKGGVIFNYDYSVAIEFQSDPEVIKINPEQLLKDIKRDFENYIKESKEPSNTFKVSRENFDRLFTVIPDKNSNSFHTQRNNKRTNKKTERGVEGTDKNDLKF